MKITKKILTVCVAVAAIAATSVTAFAASAYSTPAEVVAGITGRTEESIVSERQESGKAYGTIAAEAGKLSEFQAEMLELRKENLAAQVAAGTITQARADEILKTIEENQAVCDGTGTARIGQATGAGFGSSGVGQGLGRGNCGAGMGRGQGAGCGMNDGTCIYD